MLSLKPAKKPTERMAAPPLLPQMSACFLFWASEWIQGEGTRRKEEVSEDLRVSKGQSTKLAEHVSHEYSKVSRWTSWVSERGSLAGITLLTSMM